MKTVILFVLILTGSVFNSNAVVSKTDAVSKKSTTPISFLFIRGTQTGHGFNLQWKLSSTASVKSFIVECTYEDPYDPYSVWQTKGVIALSNGICKFSDSNLLPGIINYRITVIANDNSTLAVSDIFTEVIK